MNPYRLYLSQSKGYFYDVVAALVHCVFIAGQISQNTWMASGVDNPNVSTEKLIVDVFEMNNGLS